MKIVTITTVKNEADIIESFIRYHLNIVDEMIILNNGSTDDTSYILDKLLCEGLPLIILNDSDKYFEPMVKYNCLLKKAVNEYDADIICPLDVDEFITCPKGNPRNIIENIPNSTFYKVKWKTYVPSKTDNAEDRFVPSRITHVRDEKIETFYKVILTKDLFCNYDVRLKTGNHDLKYKEKFEGDIHCEECDELRIAHFPLRSVEQMTSKVLVSYPNTLSRKNADSSISHHYPLMFNKIRQKGFLEIEDVIEFAKQYSLEENKQKEELEYKDIKIISSPMNLDFSTDTEIRYDFNINPLNNVLDNYVYFANEIHKFRNDADTADELAKKYDKLLKEKNESETKFKRSVIKLGDKDNEIRHLEEIIYLLTEDKKDTDLNENTDESADELKNYIHYGLNNADNKIRIDDAGKNNAQISNLNEKLASLMDKRESENNLYLKQMENLKAENEFIKNNSGFKHIIPYVYLLFKSKRSELGVNLKLFGYFKKSNVFDIGYYLSENSSSINFKLGRFGPELHYICFGFAQKRQFNDNVAVFSDKNELLEYLKNNSS